MKIKTKNIIARVFYLTPLVLLIIAFYHNIGIRDSTHYISFGIPYYVGMFGFISILTYQLIKNNFVGWLLVFALYILYLVSFIVDVYSMKSDLGKTTTQEDLYYYSALLTIVILLGIPYYLIKPRKK
jgi:hypothetical protein